jgi:hypothetical protein
MVAKDFALQGLGIPLSPSFQGFFIVSSDLDCD